MSTTQACGEPYWYMKQESDSFFGQKESTVADLNGIYTITGLAAPSNDGAVLKATIDGIAVEAGDLLCLKRTDAPLWVDPNPLPTDLCSASFVGDFQYSNDVAIVEDGYTISMKDMHARLERLERQVELWKSAAMTLKEINDELQLAANEDRNEKQLDFGKPTTSNIPAQLIEGLGRTVNECAAQIDAISAYERAKKFTR